ncbi:MAG TPA: hypothetical protein VGG28_12795 [Kofleriaceae bacterium]
MSVDLQVKASGTLGIAERFADEHIRAGIEHAAEQLPDPPAGPALIVVAPQRNWPLYGEPSAIEKLIGHTTGYPDRRVLRHETSYGPLARWGTSTKLTGMYQVCTGKAIVSSRRPFAFQ